MTLLKQFTDWVTASTQTPARRLNLLRWRLCCPFNRDGSYFGTSGAAVYVFTHSLDRQLNKHTY